MGAQVADGRRWAVVAIAESFEAVTGEADDYCCSDERGPYAREVEYQSRRAYAFAPKPHL